MELIVTILIVVVIALVIRKFATPSDYKDAKGRNRCRRCKKIVYGDGESAHSAAENALSRGMYLRAYYNNRCGYWHLTSQQPRY